MRHAQEDAQYVSDVRFAENIMHAAEDSMVDGDGLTVVDANKCGNSWSEEATKREAERTKDKRFGNISTLPAPEGTEPGVNCKF